MDLTADMATDWDIVEELYEKDPLVGLYAALNLASIECAREFIKIHHRPASEEVQNMRLKNMYLNFLSFYWYEMYLVVRHEVSEDFSNRWQIYIAALSLFAVQGMEELFPDQSESDRELVERWLWSAEKIYPYPGIMRTDILAERLIDIDMTEKGSKEEFKRKEKALNKILSDPKYSNKYNWPKMPLTQLGVKKYPTNKLILV